MNATNSKHNPEAKENTISDYDFLSEITPFGKEGNEIDTVRRKRMPTKEDRITALEKEMKGFKTLVIISWIGIAVFIGVMIINLV